MTHELDIGALVLNQAGAGDHGSEPLSHPCRRAVDGLAVDLDRGESQPREPPLGHERRRCARQSFSARPGDQP